MREWLTQHNILQRNYRDDGRGGSWIGLGDIRQYIQEQLRLQQKIIKGAGNTEGDRPGTRINFMPTIQPAELSQDERNKFIWGIYNGTRNEHGGGNHYAGYLQTGNGVYLFDSWGHQSFQEKTQDDLDDFIQHTVGDVNVVYGLSPRIQTQESENEREPILPVDPSGQSANRIEIKKVNDGLARRMGNAIRKMFD